MTQPKVVDRVQLVPTSTYGAGHVAASDGRTAATSIESALLISDQSIIAVHSLFLLLAAVYERLQAKILSRKMLSPEVFTLDCVGDYCSKIPLFVFPKH
jgi:hypothetical protein